MCVARPNLCGCGDRGRLRAPHGGRAFTIIEVMLTVGILVLIAGLIAPAFTSWRREAIFDSGKVTVADMIAKCASLSQRDGVPRVLVAEVGVNGTTRLIMQTLKDTSGSQAAEPGAGRDESGDEAGPKGTVLAELDKGLALASGETGNEPKSEAGDGPVSLPLCVAMPDGMIKRSQGAIHLTQSDGTAAARSTPAPTDPVRRTTPTANGLVRSATMSIDEFTGRVSWRTDEIKADGTKAPQSKPGTENSSGNSTEGDA